MFHKVHQEFKESLFGIIYNCRIEYATISVFINIT